MELISRKAAITQLSHNKNKGDEEWKLAVENDIRTIWKLPPIESRTGKWIRDGHHIRCDQCGIYMCDTDREGDKIPNNFCPNCGVNMRGEDNEID